MSTGKESASYLADITSSDPYDLGAWSHKSDILGRRLGLLDTSTNDACICTQSNKSAGLHAADTPSAPCYEHDAVIFEDVVSFYSCSVLVG